MTMLARSPDVKTQNGSQGPRPGKNKLLQGGDILKPNSKKNIEIV
jgi:hypothetical protein